MVENATYLVLDRITNTELQNQNDRMLDLENQIKIVEVRLDKQKVEIAIEQACVKKYIEE